MPSQWQCTVQWSVLQVTESWSESLRMGARAPRDCESIKISLTVGTLQLGSFIPSRSRFLFHFSLNIKKWPGNESPSRLLGLKAEMVSIVRVQLVPWKLSVIQSSRVFTIQGCLRIEVNERTVGLLELSVISWMFAVERCLFSGVPLYQKYISPLISIHSLSTRDPR